MNNLPLIFVGKSLSSIFKTLNLGNGSTWPGHIALKGNKHFIKDILKNSHAKTIIVAGTNGKTTTSLLIKTILEKNGKKVFHNQSGANLLNGVASTLLLNADLTGKIATDYIIFEVDENALPQVLQEVQPDYLLLLNLFRDQLDRYGEVRTIAAKWKEVLSHLTDKTSLILNADDPEIAHLGITSHTKAYYFGLTDAKLSDTKHHYATDSTYCPNCGSKLSYKTTYFSHLGDWSCPKCKEKRPEITTSHVFHYPLPGVYNIYNTLAAVVLAEQTELSQNQILNGVQDFKPAFGRQEIIQYNGKRIQLFLSKNPTGFNESLRTAIGLGAKKLLLVLNDRIPDGKDVSWIWDTDVENITKGTETFFVGGDRVYDMALRIKYAGIAEKHIHANLDLSALLQESVQALSQDETLYVLPTYSAMLEVRKLLTGKKIL